MCYWSSSLKIIKWNEIEHDKSPQNSQEPIDIEPYDPDYPHKTPHKYNKDDDNIDDDDEDMCCCVNCAHKSYLEECKGEEEEK